MKINHVCLLIGVLVLLLAMTVFANAEIINFNCTSPFNCEIKDYCQAVPNAVPGLLVHNGSCGENSSQPCDYSFTSSSPGLNTCTVKVTVTAMHSQNQTNEDTTIYINGTNMGTTADNYCNGNSSENCTFCGSDVQTLPAKTVTLSQNNTLTLQGHDSHAVAGVVITCTPEYDACQNNSAPVIKTIPDKVIPYNSTTRIDLYNYVSDPNAPLSDTNISFTQNGNSVSCVQNSHYLDCTAGTTLGNTVVTVTAKDKCNGVTSKSFNINVYNQPPVLSVPDVNKSCSEDLNNFIELRNYTWDENVNASSYTLISQSDTNTLNCSITSAHYVSCVVNSCNYKDINVGIQVTDQLGSTDVDYFLVKLSNSAPKWTNTLPSQCINEPKYNFIDFRNYATDLEDKNNLKFSIVKQSNTTDIDCSIDSNRYLSCDSISNKHITNTMTIRATDTNGAYVDANLSISTNCGNIDNNNPDNNIIVESETKGVCLETCTSYTTQITVKNYSGEKKCFNFFEEHTPQAFNLTLQGNNFCLNNNESTNFSLSATTCGADSDKYKVNVIDEDNNLNLNFDYSLGTCNSFDGFSITEFDGKVCKGEKISLPVKVRNTTDTTKTIELMAENPFILPYFDRSSITLTDGQEKEVRLNINATTLSLGSYKVFIGGDAPNYHIEKILNVDVVDCTNTKRNFLIESPKICYDVKKGSTIEGSFTVKRLIGDCTYPGCTDDPLGISLSLSSSNYELSQNSLELNCLAETSVDYLIQVPSDSPAGIMLVSINGKEEPKGIFDDELLPVESNTICLNVLGESNATITLNTSVKDIEWCASQVFELQIVNTGDKDQNFTLSAINLPTGVTASFSETKVLVKKGQTKIIYVAVSTSPSSQIKDNQFFTVKVTGDVNLSSNIYFNIKEKPSFNDLEIVSSTKELSMKANSDASYSVMLRNNTENDLNNVKVSFENFPKGVVFSEIILPTLAKGETAILSGKITALDVNGLYEPVMVVSSGDIINKKKMYLNIENDNLSGINGMFGLGLFSLGGINFSEGLLAVFFALFLIILVVVLILGLARISRTEEKEKWMEMEYHEQS